METRLQTCLDRHGMAEHYTAFMRYARTFYTGKPDHDMHLALKVDHSRNVFCHTCAMTEAEPVFAASPELARALVLAGLYHDFGRFMQFARHKTFDDLYSVNHARLAVHEVKRHGMLRKEEKRVRNLTLAAVLLHNRFAVPPRLDKDALKVTNAVRDADKLDIMRVMVSHLVENGATGAEVNPVVTLGVQPSPEVSPAILEALMARRAGAYRDMRTTTDFKLLVCAWLYDLHYAYSRHTAVADGHLHALFASLPDTAELAVFKGQFEKDLAAEKVEVAGGMETCRAANDD